MTVKLFSLADTSPASASTVAGSIIRGLDQFDWFTIDADLVGATGGTLDVYLQRLIGDPSTSTTWRDWLHFPQLAAGASAIKYTAGTGPNSGIVVVGTNTSPALAANTAVAGHPGYALRALYVAGASTSAGAGVAISLTGWRSTHS